MSAVLKPSNAAGAEAVTDIDLPPIREADTRAPIRLGFWVLVVGFSLFLAWAAFAPLGEGVVAPATVSIETRKNPIQHMAGGVIQKVAVVEGQMVKAGDVLAVLDDATTRAGFESIRQNYISQRATESRLLAELTDAPGITLHADLQPENDPVVAQHVAVQRQLFNSRRAAQQAELGAAQQSILGLERQIEGLKQMLENRRAQQALQLRQFESVRQLANDGFAPRNQALQLEQTQAELRSGIAELETAIQRAQNAIQETRLRIAQRRQEVLREVSAQLADVRRDVQANQERLAAIKAELGRTQIRAPVDGQVVGLSMSSLGGVVTPGQRLMDIVPMGRPLLLDAQVPPSVIDRVRQGDAAEVRFSTFANAPQLVVHGKVTSLSHDAITEQIGSGVMSFYLARVEITPEGMKALGGRELQPGMQGEVLIKTGERSLLTYLLHPLTKRIAAAMTEE